MDTFIEFRGREPKTDALLEHLDLLEIKPGNTLSKLPSMTSEVGTAVKSAG